MIEAHEWPFVGFFLRAMRQNQLTRIFHAPEILWPVVFVQRRRM